MFLQMWRNSVCDNVCGFFYYTLAYNQTAGFNWDAILWDLEKNRSRCRQYSISSPQLQSRWAKKGWMQIKISCYKSLKSKTFSLLINSLTFLLNIPIKYVKQRSKVKLHKSSSQGAWRKINMCFHDKSHHNKIRVSFCLIKHANLSVINSYISNRM